MSGFFSAEGKLYTVASKIVDLVVVTVLWLAGCIPVVTILTSTASMYHTVVKCVRYERGKAWKDFIEAYRKNLRQGILLFFLYGIIGVCIALLDYYVAVVLTSRTGAAFILAVGALIFTVLYLINLLWIVPVFSRFADTIGKIVRLNYVIAMRHFLRGIVLLLMTIAAVILVIASNELIIIFPAILMLLSSYLTEPALRKYMPKKEEDDGDWRYGFS